MSIVHKDLKFNMALDKHFYSVLTNKKYPFDEAGIKVLDENNAFNYKDILINQTRELYE